MAQGPQQASPEFYDTSDENVCYACPACSTINYRCIFRPILCRPSMWHAICDHIEQSLRIPVVFKSHLPLPVGAVRAVLLHDIDPERLNSFDEVVECSLLGLATGRVDRIFIVPRVGELIL